MSFIDKYNQIMREGYGKIVYSYDKSFGNYEYKPFSHANIDSWKEDFIEVLINNLLNYCYEPSELESIYNPNVPELKKYINKAIKVRLNHKTTQEQRDGLCGELLIDLILRMENEKNNILICRPKYQQLGAKAELKNYDALMFREFSNKITLVLGQVKTGGFDYCTKNMRTDLDTKYDETYFGNAICYVADRRISDCPNKTLLSILSDLNTISLGTDDTKIRNNKVCEYIKENKIKIEIPCLLLYGKDAVYSDISKIKENLATEVKLVKEFFDDLSFNIYDFDFTILFYIFPSKSITELRKSIMDYKVGVLNG